MYVIAIFQGLVLVLGNPARHTLVFRIVGKDDLPNAVALGSSLGTTARIVGPGARRRSSSPWPGSAWRSP